jgi:hypothetical protein
MTMLPINWSELDQKYWIKDVDGEVLWFDSSLDAKEAQLEVILKQAALDERAAIVAFLGTKDNYDFDDLARDILAGEHLR